MPVPGGLLPLGGLPFSHGPQGKYCHHSHPSGGDDRPDETHCAGQGWTAISALEVGHRMPDQAAGNPGHEDGEESQGAGQS